MVLNQKEYFAQWRRERKNQKEAGNTYLGTDGKVFEESDAKKLSKKKHIIMICGRYEGVDARVQEKY